MQILLLLLFFDIKESLDEQRKKAMESTIRLERVQADATFYQERYQASLKNLEVMEKHSKYLEEKRDDAISLVYKHQQEIQSLQETLMQTNGECRKLLSEKNALEVLFVFFLL